MMLIEEHMLAIRELCNKYRVASLFVFGSLVKGDFHKDSDVDLLVDFKEIDHSNYADNYFALKASLEELFQRSVDLLENSAIRNPYVRSSLDASKKLVYG